MNWSLVTFAGGGATWRLAAKRLQRQARRSGVFESVTIRDEQWIARQFPSLALGAAGPIPKGYGYWRWKPHVVLDALQRGRDSGAGVLYLDAGCELNLNTRSRQRLHDYFAMAAAGAPVAMRLPASLAEWCKRETLDYFGLPESVARTTPVIEAGVLALAPTAENIDLVRAWAECSLMDDGFLFDDALEPERQSVLFQEHRHDQAVFSCLMHQRDQKGLPSETYFGPEWLPAGCDFPIWAIRNRLPVSRRPGTAGGTAIALARRVRDLVAAR